MNDGERPPMPKGRVWEKGKSGNPGGRPKGALPPVNGIVLAGELTVAGDAVRPLIANGHLLIQHAIEIALGHVGGVSTELRVNTLMRLINKLLPDAVVEQKATGGTSEQVLAAFAAAIRAKPTGGDASS